MALKNAPVCKECGIRKTKHASGLCCDCRKKAGRIVPGKMVCRICGKPRTGEQDGLCDNCRRKMLEYREDEQKRREAAIAELKTNQTIIQLRARGCTFEEIAALVGIAKTAVYRRYYMLVPKMAYLSEDIG